MKRAIRREELRQMVPLADSTIYEMEKRGEFPKRFYLTPRCAAWDFHEVQEWLKKRQTDGADSHEERHHPDVRKRKARPVRASA